MEYPNYLENVPSLENQTWLSNYPRKYDFLEGVMWLGNVSIAGMVPAYKEVSGFKLHREELLNFGDEKNLDIKAVVWDNRKFLAFIIVGLIYIFGMIVVGIGWCCSKICSYCCCKGNKRRTSYVDQEDENRKCSTHKIVCSAFMCIWIILFVCILVSAFTMNIQINNAIIDLPEDIDKPLADTESYLNITKDQFANVFVTSYGNLTKAIKNLDPSTPSTMEITEDELANIKPKFGGNSENILTSIGLLASNYSEATSLLNKYLDELSSINNQMVNLDANVQNSEEFASTANFLKSIDDDQNGVHLRDILSPPMEALLEDIPIELQSISDEFAQAIDSIDIENIRLHISELGNVLETSMPWVYRTMHAAYAILIAIVLAIVVATIFVAFRKKKSNKKGCTGPSVFFNSGTLAIFITGIFLMCLCLTLYVLCGLMQIICQGVRDLENPGKSSSSFGRKIEAFHNYTLPSYEKIIELCKLSESAYKTMELHQIYDIEQIKGLRERFEILDLAFNIEPVDSEALEIMLSSMKIAMKEASDKMQELLQDANSNVKAIDNNGTPDLKQGEHFKISFEKQNNDFNEKISIVEEQLTLLGAARFSIVISKPQGRQGFEILKEKILDQVQKYSDFVHDIIQSEVGECGPCL